MRRILKLQNCEKARRADSLFVDEEFDPTMTMVSSFFVANQIAKSPTESFPVQVLRSTLIDAFGKQIIVRSTYLEPIKWYFLSQ